MSTDDAYIVPEQPIYDDELTETIQNAISRLRNDLEAAHPFLAIHVIRWLEQLSRTGKPEDYFKNPLSFPLLLLPWWLARSLHPGKPVDAFDRDVVYSSMNGYYFIRLVDNIMDGEATVERRILPVTAFFLSTFEGSYRRYFELEHPFWETFRHIWYRSADAAVEDAHLKDIDELQFTQICAQKFVAGKIPLIAACFYYDRPDLIEPWSRFIDRLGSWHQMQNDLRDWHKDPRLEIETYLLSEARRRRRESESLMRWMIREGDAWAGDVLTKWLAEMSTMAEGLGCPFVTDYLSVRRNILELELSQRKQSFRALSRLVDAFE